MRRFELDAFVPALHGVRNALPNFAGRVVLPGTRSDLPQMPEMTQRGKETVAVFLDRIEPLMAGRDFVVGDQFTMADLIGALTVKMAAALAIDVAAGWLNVHRWYQSIMARPSMQG